MKSPIKCYVAHVKVGYEARATHMERELARHDIEFEYMLDGDMSDITPERLDRYFGGEYKLVSPISSCAMKHILIWEDMVKNNIEKALVLEDDMFLKSKFRSVLERSINDADKLHTPDEPFYVGYEATATDVIPRSQRVAEGRERSIFRAKRLQCTGAYMINKSFAQTILDYIEKNRCDDSIDTFISTLSKKGLFPIYWSYPVIAEQGTHNGRMSSSINPKMKASLWRKIKRRSTHIYKDILSNLR